MPHESGKVTALREAWVGVRFGTGETGQALVDTGFDGALVLPRAFVTQLGLPIVGSLLFELVGGAQMRADVALAAVDWLGEIQLVEVVINDGRDSLVGTELLAGARLTIDYSAQTVRIESSE